MRRIRFALILAAVLSVLAAGAALWQSGYRMYVVYTGSMAPTYDPGDVVIDRPPTAALRVGDVITFRHSASSADLVTHRITDITAEGLIHTKGDANRTPDVWDISSDRIDGVVVASLPLFGYVVTFLQQPAGVAALMTSAFAVILLWSLFFSAAARAPDPAVGPAGVPARRPRARHSAR